MKKVIFGGPRQVTRGNAKSGAVVKHQRKLVVLETTSNVKAHFKSGFAPLYCSLVTSLGTSSNVPCREASNTVSLSQIIPYWKFNYMYTQYLFLPVVHVATFSYLFILKTVAVSVQHKGK